MAPHKKISESASKRVEDLQTVLEKNAGECTREGHKKPVWFSYFVTNRSSYSDQVRGMCQHCAHPLTRPLNAYERNEIDRFREMYHNTVFR